MFIATIIAKVKIYSHIHMTAFIVMYSASHKAE